MTADDSMLQDPTGTRILVVDDEEDIRNVLVEHLSDAHLECTGAPGAFDALNKLKKHRFALVITDVLMPGMSGTELLRHIKKHDPDTEVIVVSFTSRMSTRGGLRPALSDASLKELTDATSGEVYSAALSREHPEDVVRRILQQMRTLYTFGFESTSTPDKPCNLVIKCSRPDSRVRHHPMVPVLCQ